MSWNEPGGNKKDPWSDRDPQASPPDLEDLVKSLHEKFLKLLGNSDGQGPYKSPLKSTIIIGLASITLWGLTGIYLVDEGSRGVITRFGEYSETTQPGLHWHLPSPLEKVDIVNIEQQRYVEIGYRSTGRQQSSGSVPKEALMLTQDENIIDIRLAVQYQIKDAKSYLFQVADPDQTLKQVIESAQRAVIGKSTMDFVLTEGRGRVADEIKNEIQHTLDQYQTGIRVSNVSLVDAQPPEEVQNAFEDAIKAREDEQRLKNEAEAYANEVVPKARGGAARILEEAEAYRQRAIARAEGEASRFAQLLAEYEKAPEVTRERMYLDVMQEVFENSNAVIVDTKNSNNILYLPLDKMHGQVKNPIPIRDSELPAAANSEPPEVSVRNIRSNSVRGREGRTQ